MLLAGITSWSAETWVATMTGVLALATFFLASFTWSMGRATKDEASAAIQPVLVDAPTGVFLVEREARPIFVRGASFGEMPQQVPRHLVDMGGVRVQQHPGQEVVIVGIRNGGSGAALMRGARVLTAPPEGIPAPSIAFSHTLVPLGESAQLELKFELGTPEQRLDEQEGETLSEQLSGLMTELAGCTVELAYADMHGRQHGWSDVQLTRRPDGHWDLREVQLFRETRSRLGQRRRASTPYATISR